jgi:hypothetical protein
MAHGPDALPGDSGAYRPGSVRGVEGYFRLVQQVTGLWWLLDPAGRPFFARVVHGVQAERGDTDLASAPDAAVRLRTWGFNAVGVGGDGTGRDDGLAFLGLVDFSADAPLIVARGVRLPDLFDPDWPHRAATRALAVCAPLANTVDLMGWVGDTGLAWGAPAANRPGLLQICLSLEPTFAAYHAAWEFVLALHAGRLDAMARSWGVSLANKEVVREMTKAEQGVTTRGYHRDDVRWTREFARRYFASTAAAIRAADPHHLVCGCRFQAPAGPAVLGAMQYPAVDLPLLHWSELPTTGSNVAPVLASEVTWGDEHFWGESAAPAVAERAAKRPLRLTAVERMLRRARTAMKRLARHPAVVGYAWRQWRDEPGEQPPFGRGLVHQNGAEAREHTELIADFNARAEALRRSAAKLLLP